MTRKVIPIVVVAAAIISIVAFVFAIAHPSHSSQIDQDPSPNSIENYDHDYVQGLEKLGLTAPINLRH